ncbi:MAG: 16S rRNA (uracil(1498)-N(3))-methyltransferase [Buchnera aphidicola (Brevicoryne brassicae)]|uniref:Ribosomal RNA small subunit methyltransferase E n=1 Tax=Buchnera aphidicola (Brevicoryne brassicae) TaxID=911343 RepID=A0AAJ5PTZ9_9GAMM|nr:16S rRNA (uracil(1498)-N(3))-methyltransferase [Buchnera aphidicola]WAI18789.1 MAG: 16S rRNA (uracil(1498)-N(3))-methyltransferase [Buchnera aphidicola (Brevicoryne brassicae)]
MFIKNVFLKNNNIKNYKKNIPRIYMKEKLKINETYFLSKDNMHYIQSVLRMKMQDIIEIFNDTNYIFFGKIIFLSVQIIKIKIFRNELRNIESPINIHLGQIISKNEKIDFIIQKSIEMGVNIITPLFSEYCNVQKKFFNVSHKIQRWNKIIISACQQCNRNIIPKIQNPKDILAWCQDAQENDMKIVFHPESHLTINQLNKFTKNIRIIIGPEGGLSKHEIKKIIEYGFTSIKLGPRILRTETAAIAAITALQIKFGDFII